MFIQKTGDNRCHRAVLALTIESMIDFAEEEKIPPESISPAIQIVREIIQKTREESEKQIILDFLALLQKAEEARTCVWIEM